MDRSISQMKSHPSATRTSESKSRKRESNAWTRCQISTGLHSTTALALSTLQGTASNCNALMCRAFFTPCRAGSEASDSKMFTMQSHNERAAPVLIHLKDRLVISICVDYRNTMLLQYVTGIHFIKQTAELTCQIMQQAFLSSTQIGTIGKQKSKQRTRSKRCSFLVMDCSE